MLPECSFNRNEVLDITLVSEELLDSIVSWKVVDNHSFSYHRYIELKITEKSPFIKNVVNARKTNWGYYKAKKSRCFLIVFSKLMKIVTCYGNHEYRCVWPQRSTSYTISGCLNRLIFLWKTSFPLMQKNPYLELYIQHSGLRAVNLTDSKMVSF